MSGVRDNTQVHTHMCYAEFNDIMPGIAAMDADVITIEINLFFPMPVLADFLKDLDNPV